VILFVYTGKSNSANNSTSKLTTAIKDTSRFKITLNGTTTVSKVKPQPAPRAPVVKPQSQNTVRVTNQGGGEGVEDTGERKYGTRGIKLSAKFLQNAMDVDFLNDHYTQHQPVGVICDFSSVVFRVYCNDV
jgi:hypothetical protein